MKKYIFIVWLIIVFLTPTTIPQAHAFQEAPFVGMTADWLITRYQEYPNGTLVPIVGSWVTADPLHRTMDRYSMQIRVNGELDSSQGRYVFGDIFITLEPREYPSADWSGSVYLAFENFVSDAWFFWFPNTIQQVGDIFIWEGAGDGDHNVSEVVGQHPWIGPWFFYVVEHYHNDDPNYPSDGTPLTVVNEVYRYAFFTFLECWEVHGSVTYDRHPYDRSADRTSTIIVDKATGLVVYARYERRDAFGTEWGTDQRTEIIEVQLKETNAYQWYEKYLGFLSMIIVGFLIGVVYVERRRHRSPEPKSSFPKDPYALSVSRSNPEDLNKIFLDMVKKKKKR